MAGKRKLHDAGCSCSRQSQRSGWGSTKSPPNQSKRAHEPKRKGKAPLISRKREGAKHKKIHQYCTTAPPPPSPSGPPPPAPPPPPSTPETLAAAAEILVAAAITAPLDASGARGRRSAACLSQVRAPGAALRAQSLSRLPAKRSRAPRRRRLSSPLAWQFRAVGWALLCSGSTVARLGFLRFLYFGGAGM